MKILFMGTPDFARESLESLYYEGYEICGVVCPQDRPKGRGMKMIPCPVKEFALEKNLQLFQPDKLKEIKEDIVELNPDMIVVVSYGKILPKSILDLPKFGCINVHPSLLPKYRGSAPIQWAVLNGDKTTGVTIMQMDEHMDSGDIILQKEVEIDENETTGDLWNRLSTLSSKLLLEAIKKVFDGTAEYIKQPENYTIAPMISKEMAKIDWEKLSSSQIKNLVRGLNPIMGAYCNFENKKIKFWKVDVIQDAENKKIAPGTIIMSDSKKGLYIKTKDGAISVIEIQGENARKMSINEFLRGNNLEIGKKLN